MSGLRLCINFNVSNAMLWNIFKALIIWCASTCSAMMIKCMGMSCMLICECAMFVYTHVYEGLSIKLNSLTEYSRGPCYNKQIYYYSNTLHHNTIVKQNRMPLSDLLGVGWISSNSIAFFSILSASMSLCSCESRARLLDSACGSAGSSSPEMHLQLHSLMSS